MHDCCSETPDFAYPGTEHPDLSSAFQVLSHYAVITEMTRENQERSFTLSPLGDPASITDFVRGNTDALV